MTTILSGRRAKFGMTCVQCSNELIAPNGLSFGMSGKCVIFGLSCRHRANGGYQERE